MDDISKSALKKLRQIIIPGLEDDFLGWPPDCSKIMFQPERPIVNDSDKEEN